eukprot:CAMPEP_0119122758 /NCGR_PEP_ID=MMETSP1310-20130426/2924_1 /TAXON_ID=464262 /ORGANISM="Genus nov. species nov., Strain RCC2339" /LENGTH=627 /DNA_ID=CAMNT_0007112469 /DNA_START=46 /DNA_END=1929 /DNA_ORIENTATION=+
MADPQVMKKTIRDSTSSANIDQVVAEHLHLQLSVDFDKKQLCGYAQYIFRSKMDGLTTVSLDINGLQVETVLNVSGTEVYNFIVEDAQNGLGQCLTIVLNESVNMGESVVLRIQYVTSPDASGLQWLPPQQTEGKKYPYLFSQFQAIHCRSALPCQDTPAVKIPYSASITVPKPLAAMMSALARKSAPSDDRIVYTFEQPVPIPSYLIAIVVGNLESREISARCRVYCEPEKIDACEKEFSNTEKYLQAAESITFPYVWERYDLLVLPSSFPYGGMENPCLTFVTPTLIAGDQSNTNVVAHEIAHSWSGNLVTNSSWRHFWLNEGFTVFLERKIIGRLHGEPHRQFAHLRGHKALTDSIERYGEGGAQFTKLLLDDSSEDPDIAFSSVPYEKGSQFLFFLEHTITNTLRAAGKDPDGELGFECCVRAWFAAHERTSVTTSDFRSHFERFYSDPCFEQAKDKVDWDLWLNSTGFPPVDVHSMFDDTLAKRAKALVSDWVEGRPVESNSMDGWTTVEVTYFLDNLLLEDSAKLSMDLTKKMAELYHFDKSSNYEIRFRWACLVLVTKLEDHYDDVIAILGSQGRMKFLRPLYRELFQVDKDLALSTFVAHNSKYHNIARKMVGVDLGVE